MKTFYLRILLLSTITFYFGANAALAQNQYRKPVRATKNVILMIPDGTSIGVTSAARWYQIYNKLGSDQLAIDPYLCGTVKTYNSNAPIGDSAPTTSCYMTGYLSQAGNVAIYPEVDPVHDIHPVDQKKAFQPLATVLEAAKHELNKSTGLVATVEFTHATPADCSAHHYNRSKYSILASQQVANKIDVVIAGGNDYLDADLERELVASGTRIIRDDVDALRNFDASQNLWALFGKTNMPYDMDRDNSTTPSLAEMTDKAIERLAKNENGFFLMVEGSQIDWAAHANDAAPLITDYLAFDRAVQVAIDFAKSNTETTVIVVSDHGNSGFTIGNRELKNYARRGLDDLFGNVSKIKSSTRKLEALLEKANPNDFNSIIKTHTGIEITEDEKKTLLMSKNYKQGDYTAVSSSASLSSSLVGIMNKHNYFGFTTGGHTGEDVLLAAYHPQGDVPMGMNTNIELNKYLCDVTGLQRPLDEITNEIFAKHSDVFTGCHVKIEDANKDFPTLRVEKGKNKLTILANKSTAYLNGEAIDLKSVVVYIDKNNTFYVPRFLRDKVVGH